MLKSQTYFKLIEEKEIYITTTNNKQENARLVYYPENNSIKNKRFSPNNFYYTDMLRILLSIPITNNYIIQPQEYKEIKELF